MVQVIAKRDSSKPSKYWNSQDLLHFFSAWVSRLGAFIVPKVPYAFRHQVMVLQDRMDIFPNICCVHDVVEGSLVNRAAAEWTGHIRRASVDRYGSVR